MHADQAGADLARQADALRLAAGQGLGAAVQRQIVQAHVDQKSQPLADLLDDPGRDLAAPARQAQLREDVRGRAHRQGGDLGQGGVGHVDMARGRGSGARRRIRDRARAAVRASSSRTVSDSVSR